MVRMDKLLDAWRADPRVEPTVELCAMLTRACMKPGARDVIPMAFVVALATEAIIKHPRSVEVLLALATLYHAAGEMRAAATVLEKAKVFAGEDQRVINLANKVKLARATRELVSDAAPRQLAPATSAASRTSVPPSARTGSQKPSSAPVDPRAESQLDAETFDAPTTPLDPPTEPTGLTGREVADAHPRRALTTHGLAPPPSTPPPPLKQAPVEPAAATTSKGEKPDSDPNPRRSRTLLGGQGMLAPPAPMAQPVARPPIVPAQISEKTSTTDSGIDDEDSGPSTTVDKVFSPQEPKTTQREVPQIPLRPPPKAPPVQPTDEPRTTQREVPQIPTRNPASTAPPLNLRGPGPAALSAPTRPRGAGLPPPTPSQGTTTVGAEPRGWADDPQTSTRVGAPPDAEMSRPAARRLAARKPGGRGVGTDDPLMKAALARRARMPGTGSGIIPEVSDAGPVTRAEHDVPTKVGQLGGSDDQPTRNLVAPGEPITAILRPGAGLPQMADPESAQTRTRSGPLPIGARGPDSDRAATSRGPLPIGARGPDSDRAATARGPVIPMMMSDITTARGPNISSPESTQTEVDSVSEDAPTRTLTGAPPTALPVLGRESTSDQETSESSYNSGLSSPSGRDESTFSKLVTTRWQQGSMPPIDLAARGPFKGPPPSSPPTNQTDDSVDTHLRPLAPLARPTMKQPEARPLPKMGPPAFAPPRVSPPQEDDGPGTYVMKPAESAAAARSPYAPPKPAPRHQEEDEGPGTHVMRAEEVRAAAKIHPLAGSYSGLRSDIPGTIDPADVLDDDSSSGPMPMPISFGHPPAIVTRGVAFGAGAQSMSEPRPNAPLDFGLPNMSFPAMGLPDAGPNSSGLGSPNHGSNTGLPDFGGGQGFPEPGNYDQQRGGYGGPGDQLGSHAQSGGNAYDAFNQPAEGNGYLPPYPSSQFPVDQSYPSDDGLPPINFDPIPIPIQGEAQAFPSNTPPPGVMPEPVMDTRASDPEVRKRPLGLYIALAVAAVAVAVLVGYASFLVISDYKRTAVAQAPKPTTEVEKALLAGTPADLARADALLVELEKNPSRDVALMRVRTEAIKSIEVSGKEEGLPSALDAAHAVGLGAEVACGEVALAVAQQDKKKVDEILARVDGELAKDPFFQLAAGAALEASGDPKAVDRYDAAIAIEPQFSAARVRAIRTLLLDGDLTEAEKRLADLPESASRTALQALAWVAGRAAGATETVARPKTLPTTAEVPRELLAAYAATSLIDAEKGDPSTLTKRGIDEADSPSVAVLFGRIALNRGDVTSAAAGARRALVMGPRYAPALRLLGRTAVEIGKFDIMKEVLATLPEEATRELRSLRAYEMGDLDELATIASKVAETDPERLVVSARLDRLRGLAPLSDDRIARLVSADALGGDLCAVDALLDRGNLAKAKELIGHWPDAAAQPLRARRYARLMRYEGNLDEALLALGGATTTVPTASLERMILDAEIPKHRQEALDLLSERPSPLDIPAPTAKLVEGYIRARNDDLKAAKELLDTASIPSKQTALPTRVCAALAFGEVKDKRAESLVRDLYGSFPLNPDVLRAAQALGIATTEPTKP